MPLDRPLLGILLMLGFCVLALLGDAVAKLLGQSLHVAFLVFIRFAIQAMVLLPIVWLSRKHLRMTKRVFRLTILRTLLHIIGISSMFSALKYLPLADAVAIVFVMPFIILLLGKFILHEDVGPRRTSACLVGFAGTMLVVQPSFADVGLPALLPLLVVLVFALFMLVTRQIAKECDPISLQALSGLMATVILAPVLMLGVYTNAIEVSLTLPNAHNIWLLLAIGILGTVAHLMMTWSLRFAPSATLAPMQYLEIPIATLIGWWIFSDFPNGLAAIGIVITIGAGLYVIWTEQAIAQAASQAP